MAVYPVRVKKRRIECCDIYLTACQEGILRENTVNVIVGLGHMTVLLYFILVWTLSDGHSKKLPLKQMSLKNLKKKRK